MFAESHIVVVNDVLDHSRLTCSLFSIYNNFNTHSGFYSLFVTRNTQLLMIMIMNSQEKVFVLSCHCPAFNIF